MYLEISGRANEALTTKSLDASGLTLLRYKKSDVENNSDHATVFASAAGVEKLRKKVDEFRTQNTEDRVSKDGKNVPGRPKNADLVQSLDAIVEAELIALWRSPLERFPNGNEKFAWEIWLDPENAERFIRSVEQFDIAVAKDRLHFPNDVVVIAIATRHALLHAVRKLAVVRALAVPATLNNDFDSLDPEEQWEWVDELQQRCRYFPNVNPGYVTLLDTGISLSHPLLQPAFSREDRYAAKPEWGLEDVKGHGTALAGLALMGDLSSALRQTMPIDIHNRLESAKLLPDADSNPHHLLGTITENAVNAVECKPHRRRTFTMAVTTDQDSPHDGAPTSWSTSMDQLASGISGQHKQKRLVLISAGNTDNRSFGIGNYLERCDHPDHELESPAQAWNPIAIGAYTEKVVLPSGITGAPLASFGDLSPSSRTASWSSTWPIKPDVVLEGGNWINQPPGPPMRHEDLGLLTTHHNYPLRSFALTCDTSAATALAAKQVTELWTEYPDLWPETIRGLFVSSARWTKQMKSHVSDWKKKGQLEVLFRRYGYGVPDLARARHSASNALTLIVEDTISPYRLNDKKNGAIHNELRLFPLPWPLEALRALADANVTLRVTLSTFIEPNPSEPARGSKFRYASHNLRFKLNRADELEGAFLGRISNLVDEEDDQMMFQSEENDGWDFGPKRRDVGSLQIDQLTCKASDLARRNLLAVYPVAGWWKEKSYLKNFGDHPPVCRYALIVEIDAENLLTDLYTEVQSAIDAMVKAGAIIST